MRHLKRLSASLLPILFLLLLAGEAPGAELRPIFAASNARVGDTVTLDVKVDSVTNLAGFQVNFSFDPNILAVTAVAINSGFNRTVRNTFDNVAGRGLAAAYALTGTPISGTNVTLATLTLTAKGVGTSVSALSNQLLGAPGGAEIPSTLGAGGTITITTTPPTVISATPTNGSTGVSVSAAISATFSTNMDPTTITAATFMLNGGAVTGTVSYDPVARTATFIPYVPLTYGSSYTATVSTGAKDLAGNALAANFTWSFTTQALFPLTIVKQGSGTGTVSSDLPGISCGASCFASYPGGNTVLLTAAADAGSVFTGWGGSCSGSQNTLSLLMNGPKNCTATFTPSADAVPPTVTSFTLPATATSLTVPVTSFTASDNVAVTGYLLSEVSTQPLATDPNWTPSPPSSYTFATQGSRTLYAFARDAAGNISGALSATVTITLSDTAPPTVTSFILPTTATSLTVPVTSFTASDNVAVTGYLLSEVSTQPLATDPNWTPSPPSSHTFAAPGLKTLYAYAKDAAGNVSGAASATVAITLTDTVPPTVTSFTLPAAAASLTVGVTSLTARDNVGVTAYSLSENPAPPPATDPGWTPIPPTSYTFASAGTKTLYAFARDGAGNVSAPLSATVTITLTDTVPPTVTSFTLPATATSLTVPVTSFAASDDVGVTGYLLSESPVRSLPTDPGWTPSASGSYTFASAGAKTLYAFAKDGAGNVSAPLSATVTIILPDTVPPTVTSFSLPPTATSLTVPVTSFTAVDNVGVAGYILTENPATPSLTDPNWTPIQSASYTFATPGTKTLYAFARDAAGNVSAPLSAMVTITLPDTTPPTVTGFSLPPTATSLTVPVLSFTATDDVGVVGYLLNEGKTHSPATDPAWTPIPWASFTFITPGTKTLYAFAKDGAGNVSTPLSASVTITLAPTTYTIYVIPTQDGSVLPSGSVAVSAGGSATFTIVPRKGYSIKDVIVDGVSVGPVVSYTFANCRSNHTIEALFSPPDGHLDPNNSSGQITIADAVIALGIAIGRITPTPEQMLRGDVAPLVNGRPAPDGRIDIGDAVVILRKVVGLVSW
jgi:hypothetical protein